MWNQEADGKILKPHLREQFRHLTVVQTKRMCQVKLQQRYVDRLLRCSLLGSGSNWLKWGKQLSVGDVNANPTMQGKKSLQLRMNSRRAKLGFIVRRQPFLTIV